MVKLGVVIKYEVEGYDQYRFLNGGVGDRIITSSFRVMTKLGVVTNNESWMF